MRATFLLTTVALLVTAAVLVPAATAQSTPPAPKIEVFVKWGYDHDSMELPESGRVDMPLIVEVYGVDFVCSQPMKFKVEIEISSFPKWAGSSAVPKTVPTGTTSFFEFETGQPGFTRKHAKGSPNNDGKLNIAWDLEGAPKKDAANPYKVRGIIKTEADGACAPQVSNRQNPWSPEMTVKLPDRLDDPNGTAKPEICDDNPFAPGCPGATSAQVKEGGDAPGPDVLIILLGLVGMVGIWRRNHK